MRDGLGRTWIALLMGGALMPPGCGSESPTAPAPTPAPPTATPAPVETTTEFASTDVPKDIPNGTRTRSVLDVSGAATPGLQRFVNKQVEGRWTLLADDTQLQDKGRLISWSIRLRLRR